MTNHDHTVGQESSPAGPLPFALAEGKATHLRDALVTTVTERYPAISTTTQAAMRAVPRHLFLPAVAPEQAYADIAVVTRVDDVGAAISSASQPTMIAIMLDQLLAAPGMRILEIGAGTGYNAALLATLVGPTGHVTTVDLDATTTDAACHHLATAGFGPERVTVICGDGAQGWASAAPYDRVILTVGAWDVMPAWFSQLADGGRLVLPLAMHTVQICMALTRQGATLITASLQPCGFMRLRGPFAGPETMQSLPENEGMRLLAEPPAPPVVQLGALLQTTPRTRQLTDVQTIHLRFALALMDKPLLSLLASSLHPTLGQHATGIITPEGDSACWIVLDGTEGTRPLLVEYGAATAALQLDAFIDEWRALGQPSLNRWQLTCYPKGQGPTLIPPRAYLITKDYWDIVAVCTE